MTSAPPNSHMGPLPRWASGRQLARVVLALGALVVVATALFINFERREIAEDSLGRAELFARILDQQAAAVLSSADSGLRTLDDALDELLPGVVTAADSARMSGVLADAFRDRPFIRSASVVNSAGLVIASSSAVNIGLRLDLALFGRMPTPQMGSVFGALLMGRDLDDLSPPKPGLRGSPLLPLLRSRVLANGQLVYLVQMVNLDYFAGQFELTLEGSNTYATLSSFGGIVFTSSTRLAPAAGKSIGQLPAFHDFLPQKESGSYQGVGLSGPDAITAFRTLRQWPLVVLVEIPHAQLALRLQQIALSATALAAFVLLLLGGATVLLLRSLRRYEALLYDIDQINRLVAASDARNNAVLDSALDGILTINARDEIVAFNPAAERIFGRPAKEVMGQPMAELLVPKSHRSAHTAGMQRFLQSGHGPILNQRLEVDALRADGSNFPMELTVVAVRIAGEKFFTATVRDITDRRRSEAEKAVLLGSYRKLAGDLEIQKLALDQHAIVSIANVNGTITYANDKLVEISGFAREELVGRQFYDFREHTLAPHEYEEMRASLDAQKVWRGETAHRRRDGSLYWVATTMVPVFDSTGFLSELITVQTDITARREAEIALAQARARELEIGNRIQQTLLVAPPVQDLAGLWISAFNQASKGIDGDFFEIIRVGENAVDLVAGDVMGKGVPAAMMGAATKLQFSRSIAELLTARRPGAGPPQPREVVTAVNRTMAPHLQALDAFVTLVYLRIDLAANTVVWVGCGHEESLLIHSNGDATLLGNQHPPIGLFLDAQFDQDERELLEGDAIFMCSDGASDALQADGERVGRDRVNSHVLRYARGGGDPAMVLHALRRDLLLERVTMTDDLTMVMLSRQDVRRHLARLEVPVSLDSLRTVREFVTAQALEAGFADEAAGPVTVAAIEVLTNVIRHAQGLVPGCPVVLVAEHTPHHLVMEFRYLGDRYDPPEDPPETDFAAFPEGGFGLYIIHSVCDELDYLHDDGVNTVRMSISKPA